MYGVQKVWQFKTAKDQPFSSFLVAFGDGQAHRKRGENLENMKFVDDIVLCSDTREDVGCSLVDVVLLFSAR